MAKSTELIAIIGPGLTGASLAVLFAGHGYETIMLALDDNDAQSGLDRTKTHFDDLVDEGLIGSDRAAASMQRIKSTTKYENIAHAALIFECVYENTEVKRSVYELVERHCSQYKALLSATSAILPDELAKDLKHPDRFLVAHPWNPPHMVPCVEVVGCESTSQESLEYTLNILRATGRKPIVMNKPVAGFIGNRLQHALYREAVHMVEEGIASPEDIDDAILTSFGPRFASVGLFEHFDNVGLVTARNVENYLLPYLCDGKQAGKILVEHIERNELGVRAGKGMREWTPEKAEDFRRRASSPYKAFFNWS